MTWHKFNAKKTKCALDHPHPSQLEASVCALLQLRQRAGDIRNLKWQHTIHLKFSIMGTEYSKSWKVDFSFEQAPTWTETYAEAKGHEDNVFKDKLKLYRAGAGGPFKLELWYGSARRPFLKEIVIPKGMA